MLGAGGVGAVGLVALFPFLLDFDLASFTDVPLVDALAVGYRSGLVCTEKLD